jgi:hypothetical protein
MDRIAVDRSTYAVVAESFFAGDSESPTLLYFRTHLKREGVIDAKLLALGNTAANGDPGIRGFDLGVRC